MSLKHAAQHLAAQGRGPDTTLVHMTPREVSGLQAIAKAHGGSLTINPETGLAEAGFLDKLMPMIVGAGLAYATGGMSLGAGLGMAGVSNAAIIGGGIGALETMRTGDLGKGIMSGLGAYGGAGLGGAAESAGMFKGADATSGLTVPQAPTTSPAMPGFGSGDAAMDSFVGNNGMTNVPQATLPDNIDIGGGFNPATGSAASPIHAAPPSMGELIMQHKGYAAAGAAPAIMDAMSPKRDVPEGTDQMIRPYTFDYNRQQVSNPIGATRQDGQDTSERLYFQPQYTALTPYKAAGGGLMSLAGGGPVEQMSNANAIGANTGYPMANVNKAAYSTPYQTPVSQNMVTGTADTGVNPMTGEENRFAEGGITGSGNLDLHIPLDMGGGGGGGQQGGGFGGGGGFGQQGGGQQSILGGGANGYSGAGSSGGQGGFGGGLGLQPMPAQPQQDPFANDDNFKNYQTQMQGMQNDFLNSDQYKNMDQLRQTMLNYQQQRLGTAGSPSLNTPDLQAAARAAYNPNNSTPYAGQGGFGPNPNGAVPQGGGNGLGGTGLDPRAVAANPQGFQQFLQGAQQQETQRPGSTMFSQLGGAGMGAMGMAQGGMAYAGGGISTLGGYSDGGRLLKGPGDGMSDNIPASIGRKQPARLADGEFVVPADVVSHLGNGSTDAGAKQLYKMMDRIRSARTGRKAQGKQIKADKYLPK
jgi:hypothetical protein